MLQITIHPSLYGVMREILAQNLHCRIMMKKLAKGIAIDYKKDAWEKLDRVTLEAFYRYADEMLTTRYGVGVNPGAIAATTVPLLTEKPESITVEPSALESESSSSTKPSEQEKSALLLV